MIKLLPFHINKYKLKLKAEDIYERFDNFLDENKFKYTYTKNYEKSHFSFEPLNGRFSGNDYYRVKVILVENKDFTLVKAFFIAGKPLLVFLSFFLIPAISFLIFAKENQLIGIIGIVIIYLFLINMNKQEYLKPNKDFLKIINSNSKTAFKYFQEFTAEHNKLTDLELIFLFNKQVENAGSGIARQGYLWSLKEQLNERKIDYSSVGNENAISYKHCVILKNKKLYKITELNKSEVEKIFNEYFKINYSEKLIFNPKIAEYDNEILRFGMAKHFGILNVSVNKMIKEWQKE